MGGGSSGARRIGSVSIIQSSTEAAGQTFYSGIILASFFDIPAGFPDCVRTTVGACTVSDCTAAADAGTPPDGGQVGAGQVTISGLVDGGVVLSPNAQGSYSAFLQTRLFTPGTQVQVQASGGAVPMFSAQVGAPAAPTLTSPVCTLTGCGMISKTAPYTLTWTGGTNTVSVQVLSATGQLSCSFPATAGTGTIPAAALAAFPAGAVVNLFVSAENSTTVQAGSFPVGISAQDSRSYTATISP